MGVKINLKSNIKVSETDILKFAVMMMCISEMLQSSIIFQTWTFLINALKYMVPVLGLLVFFLKQRKKTSIGIAFKSIVICAIILCTCLLTKDFSYLLVCIILVLSRNLKIDDFIKISLSVLMIFGGIQILIWIINAIIGLGYPVYYNVTEKRISFLFIHPNIAVVKLGWGVIMYIWLQWEKLTHKKILCCYLIAIFLYVTTKSDACIVLLLYLILVSVRKNRWIQTMVIFLSRYCFLIFGFFSFTVAKLYASNGRWMTVIRKIDLLFSRRFAMAYLAIKNNGISIIGQTIDRYHEWDQLFNFGNYTIDSLYIYFYVCIGIIYFFIIGIGFFQLGKYKNYKIAAVVLIFSLYAMIEVHCLYLSNCFVLLLLKYVIFKEKKIE